MPPTHNEAGASDGAMSTKPVPLSDALKLAPELTLAAPSLYASDDSSMFYEVHFIDDAETPLVQTVAGVANVACDNSKFTPMLHTFAADLNIVASTPATSGSYPSNYLS